MTSVSTPKVSRGLRSLPSAATTKSNNIQAERNALMKEIAEIEQWWRSDRWKGTTRTYSGECICMLSMNVVFINDWYNSFSVMLSQYPFSTFFHSQFTT